MVYLSVNIGPIRTRASLNLFRKRTRNSVEIRKTITVQWVRGQTIVSIKSIYQDVRSLYVCYLDGYGWHWNIEKLFWVQLFCLRICYLTTVCPPLFQSRSLYLSNCRKSKTYTFRKKKIVTHRAFSSTNIIALRQYFGITGKNECPNLYVSSDYLPPILLWPSLHKCKIN